MENNCGLRNFCFLTVKWRKELERASVHALMTMFGVSQLNELLLAIVLGERVNKKAIQPILSPNVSNAEASSGPMPLNSKSIREGHNGWIAHTMDFPCGDLGLCPISDLE